MKEELERRSDDQEDVSSTQSSQQTSIDILRNQLDDYLSLDYNVSFDKIVEQIVDELKKERKEFHERYTSLEKTYRELRLGKSS